MRTQGHNANSPQKAAQNAEQRDTEGAQHSSARERMLRADWSPDPRGATPGGQKHDLGAKKGACQYPKKGFGQTKEKMLWQEGLICSSKGYGLLATWLDRQAR